MEIRPIGSSSRGNCYYVTDGHTPVLLDCGLTSVEINRALGFKLHGIKGVLLTHEHMDHAKAAAKLAHRGTLIYTGKATADFLDLELQNVRDVRHGEPFELGTWRITPFMLHHDAQEPYGFQLRSGGECLVYITDSPFTEFKFQGMTHIMVEANYDIDALSDNVDRGVLPAAARHRIVRSHFSIQNAIAFLKANDLRLVQEIHLIHLSDKNSTAVDFRDRVARATGKIVKVASA